VKDAAELPLFEDPSGARVYTVAELTADVRATLEGAFAGEVVVRGELSNFTHHRSGHMYFSLKDEEAVLRCVFFRRENKRLRFSPAAGLEVIARGRLGVYPPQGTYQLYVAALVLHGEGELMAALERLKKKLAAEGLFAEERKRHLPPFPRSVGVVTSPSGAAFRDVKNVLARRWPGVKIILGPAQVQGAAAAADIARAIEDFDGAAVADVLIVGRGGGSLEDLWAFNEEVVVRAVAASATPTISAVGHEVDWTLTDLAADVRAPTPSAAAELAVPVKAEVVTEVGDAFGRMHAAARDYLECGRDELAAVKGSYGFRSVPMRLVERRQAVDEAGARAARAVHNGLARVRSRYVEAAGAFRALSPAATLARGYNLATRRRATVRRAADAVKDEELTLHFADGVRAVTVTGEREGESFAEEN